MAHDSKRILILEAAAKRFVHFGLAKTTMMDIAHDLAMSKALLYYYFPDKNSLYTAVFEREMQESFQDTVEKLVAFDDVNESFMFLLDSRMDFVKRNFNLLDYSATALQQRPKETLVLFQKARDVQKTLIERVVEKGIKSFQLQDVPVKNISELIQFALEGMRLSILKDIEGLPFPTHEEFNKILAMQKTLCAVLLNGLRTENSPLKCEWENDLSEN